MAISRSDRAKQFLPFDALKGLQDALREKEIEYVEKRELTEESLEELSKILNQIEKENEIKVTYYINRQYKGVKGKVKEINLVKKKITLYDDTKICFEDILSIEKL